MQLPFVQRIETMSGQRSVKQPNALTTLYTYVYVSIMESGDDVIILELVKTNYNILKLDSLRWAQVSHPSGKTNGGVSWWVHKDLRSRDQEWSFPRRRPCSPLHKVYANLDEDPRVGNNWRNCKCSAPGARWVLALCTFGEFHNALKINEKYNIDVSFGHWTGHWNHSSR